MGFFSSIKKIWSSNKEQSPTVDNNQLNKEEQNNTKIYTANVDTEWKEKLTVELRAAEPKLSAWLFYVLEDITSVNAYFWERLNFFLASLEVPEEEAKKFIESFKKWLEEMDYEQVDEFRSELQYRLALALDLEDEEDERSRLILKLSHGLEKTREHLSKHLDSLIKGHKSFDQKFWDEFEEILIMSDVGYEVATSLIEKLKTRIAKLGLDNPEEFKNILAEELNSIFENKKRINAVNLPEVVLMIGVNGVGKTTTIAKLAHRAQMQGRKVLIAAGDTFRAAAIEQLELWANRVGAGFFAKKAGSDPAAVAFEALDKAINEGYDLLFIDTAGRLQTKVNLMEELQKIYRVLEKKHPGAPHRSILVIDATTGQNALSQTKLFKEACGIDEIILTKLDGTAKGGVAVAVVMQHNIPITFIGLGEKMDDLRPFDGLEFSNALLGIDSQNK